VAVLIFIGIMPGSGISGQFRAGSLPTWEVEQPVSMIFVMDSLPPTSGSLAAGNPSVPDEHLTDPAIDTMILMLAEKGIDLYETAETPDGIVGTEEIVIIKGNYQWNGRNTTNTDRVKGLIWRVLNHPDDFSGEILVCDNTQDIGTGINQADNNSEDLGQSIIDVVLTFYTKGYPVYYLDWVYIWDNVASEYSEGDYSDGYVYEEISKITYPKFKSPLSNTYISLRYGVWDSLTSTYDSSGLCVIDFPVLKAHGWAGSTIAIKNWIGVMTTAYSTERFGSFNDMHNIYYFGSHALVARTLAVTYPDLTFIDATWTTRQGPVNPTDVVNTNMMMASTDPAAASWYAAKYILTPVAVYPNQTDPDNPGGTYNNILTTWTNFLSDSCNIPCTRDSSEISVYDRWLFPDNINPAVLVSSPQSGETYTVLPDLTIHFSDDRNIDRGYFQLDGCESGWSEFWDYNCGGNDTSITWTIPDLPGGEYSLFFKVCDDAGNVNADSCTYTWEFNYQPYICGDANSDGTANVSDAVHIINYVFIGGDAPDPMEAGNVNCDGAVNVSDAVWIINYVFVGGNVPCDINGDEIPDC
ncbi:MAG: DUF362 domain-containing protein, partial [candidate division Zixibacteria bacterium]|nr:DUF362 domain-containing protein [candidate division Zixibacteria bacterium]NIW42643.1 DUF362 domain-containing protein [candidate division Zixibacteria bacterium]NIX59245.1 DUF362 domain-containing protein [candidate division Zixibacteria bacterium]